MTPVIWLAYNPGRGISLLAAMALPACVLVARRAVRR